MLVGRLISFWSGVFIIIECGNSSSGVFLKMFEGDSFHSYIKFWAQLTVMSVKDVL